MTNIAMENGHRNSGFSHWKWWFSTAMLNYQRVHKLIQIPFPYAYYASSMLSLSHFLNDIWVVAVCWVGRVRKGQACQLRYESLGSAWSTVRVLTQVDILLGDLEHYFYEFPFSWECSSSQLTNSNLFQRGFSSTTNQVDICLLMISAWLRRVGPGTSTFKWPRWVTMSGHGK